MDWLSTFDPSRKGISSSHNLFKTQLEVVPHEIRCQWCKIERMGIQIYRMDPLDNNHNLWKVSEQ